MAFPLPLPMRRALDLAREAAAAGEVPVGAVITLGDEIVAESRNAMRSVNDPTAHAEIVAIREACRVLGDYQLSGCDVYSSCEPCPMCLGALFWARPARVFFAATQDDAAAAGFDDRAIHIQMRLPHSERSIPMEQLVSESATRPFEAWVNQQDRISY
jgi:tRNA(Arg) A34 adenosine deaminase TadA